MRVLIAGGGTGGHVIPALAIARELKARYNAEVLFVGTARGIENRLVPAAGFGLMRVKVGALKNVSLLTRLRTLLALPLAILAARKIIQVFDPDVVVGVGGYASVFSQRASRGRAGAAGILQGRGIGQQSPADSVGFWRQPGRPCDQCGHDRSHHGSATADFRAARDPSDGRARL